jgi:hypothetical protein
MIFALVPIGDRVEIAGCVGEVAWLLELQEGWKIGKFEAGLPRVDSTNPALETSVPLSAKAAPAPAGELNTCSGLGGDEPGQERDR